MRKHILSALTENPGDKEKDKNMFPRLHELEDDGKLIRLQKSAL